MSVLADKVRNDAEKSGLERLLLVDTLVVAVSGGADSLALLRVLMELRGEHANAGLHVAHLDHGFRGPESAEDARFVEGLADSWGLERTVAYFDVPTYASDHKLSFEDAARRVRYAFLAGVAQRHGGMVAVAHTADDQAETVLMHLLRGSGTGGLSGMRMLSERPVGANDPQVAALLPQPESARIRVFRPLLGAWRWEIEAYCRENGLAPRTDSTNLDTIYRRNYIRHKVLPSLEAAGPRIKRHLANLAKIASAEDDLLREITTEAWDALQIRIEGHRVAVSSEELAGLQLGVARRIVRRMLETVADDTEGFSFDQIEGAHSVLAALPQTPRVIDLPCGIRVRRSGTSGIVERRLANDSDAPTRESARPLVREDTCLQLLLGSIHPLTNGWEVSTAVLNASESLPVPGDYVALFDLDALSQPQRLELRTRRPGDSMQPFGMPGRKKLQDLLVDAKIPLDVRNHLPLIALPNAGAELLWVPGPGGRRSASAPISGSTRRVLCIEFRRSEEHSREAEDSA